MTSAGLSMRSKGQDLDLLGVDDCNYGPAATGSKAVDHEVEVLQ